MACKSLRKDAHTLAQCCVNKLNHSPALCWTIDQLADIAEERPTRHWMDKPNEYECSLSVGSAGSNMFVHGSMEATKLCKEKLLRMEGAEGIVAEVYKVVSRYTQHACFTSSTCSPASIEGLACRIEHALKGRKS